jgi:sulfite reductase (NADPH) flavoprotein alpha-component
MAVPAELLSVSKHRLLGELVEGLDAQSLLWMSGYMAGLAVRDDETTLPRVSNEAAASEPAATLAVLYGSQTGNAKRWAVQFAEEAKAAGLTVTLSSTGRYKPRKLKSETHLLVVISTQGDGEPPDDALDFMEFVQGRKAPRLDSLNYAVLALGDSSYPDFCVTGRLLDERLAELGAHRLADRADCDLDIETLAEPWWAKTLPSFRESMPAEGATPHVASVTPLHPAASYSRARPFVAEVLENQRITASETDKEVRHLELSLEESGLRYQPGDSLGVWPRNPAVAVEAMLEALGAEGDRPVEKKGESRSLREWLTHKCEITQLSKPLLAAHAERSGDAGLERLLKADNRTELAGFLDTHQPIDLLRRWPADWSPEAWVDALRPLTPRLYSIASSPLAAEDEVHLTVARVAYEAFDAPHVGAASDYLCAHDDEEEADIAVYVEENPRFRLPEDPATDIIMIGAGTGVAPFRAFLQERAERAGPGRNWLFFGARHFHSQFLYQLEWQRWLDAGVLERIDLAFSRDRPERVYVQDRLAEQGQAVYEWIESGAHVYVCGGIDMEKAVAATLQAIAADERGGEESTGEWFAGLKRDGRYLRDVY